MRIILNRGIFCAKKEIKESEVKPSCYFVSVDSKKRITIPLVKKNNNIYRVNKLSSLSNNLYCKYEEYKSKKYAYIQEINKF